MPDPASLGTPMSGDDQELLVLAEDRPKGKSPKEVHKLSIDRVEATVERVIQNRMRKMDRYNGISLFREAKKARDGGVLPGDTPDIQCLFRLRQLFDQALDVEDPEERIRLQDSIMDKITKLCDRLEEQNGKIVQELQDLLERDRQRQLAKDQFSPDELYRVAGQAKRA